MSFAREKRLLLGLLALLVPLPLPLNDAISWGVLLLFEMAVALYLHRVWRGHDRWLPNWALNLMGLVYLPLLALDILASGRAQALRPVLHLALYGLVAKLFSLRRERDKWQVTIGLFVVFLAAMATSVHPAVLLYLAAFLGAALWTLVRFAYLHLLASFGQRELPGVKLPVARLLAVSTVATLVLAVAITIISLISYSA
ncbi:MAG TPA: transglutaminaseTgpA domain-containing protein, partial [Thermoanaerobaculia bacterium]|nr:transglutaminaseTgpA domain-containing protein [Thermoanaerobaculia bacterium]